MKNRPGLAQFKMSNFEILSLEHPVHHSEIKFDQIVKESDQSHRLTIKSFLFGAPRFRQSAVPRVAHVPAKTKFSFSTFEIKNRFLTTKNLDWVRTDWTIYQPIGLLLKSPRTCKCYCKLFKLEIVFNTAFDSIEYYKTSHLKFQIYHL